MAISCSVSFAVLVLLPAILFVSADTCENPEVKSNVYTSTDAILSTDTVFIVEFQLSCSNGLQHLNLYAQFQGAIIPVTKSEDGHFQVTTSGSHKSFPVASYGVQFYDEDGFAALRKVQRARESTSNVKPLFTIDFKHPGVWTGPLVQSEMVAIGVATILWYVAYSAKSRLQS